MKTPVNQTHIVLHPVPSMVEAEFVGDELHINVCTDKRRYQHQKQYGDSGTTKSSVAIYKIDSYADGENKVVFTSCIHCDQGTDVFPTLCDLIKYLEPDMWQEWYNIIMSDSIYFVRGKNWCVKMENAPGYMAAVKIDYKVNVKDWNYGDNVKHND